jgi:hypothetical protein
MLLTIAFALFAAQVLAWVLLPTEPRASTAPAAELLPEPAAA